MSNGIPELQTTTEKLDYLVNRVEEILDDNKKLKQTNAELLQAVKQYLEAIRANYELDPSGEIEDKLKKLINKSEGGKGKV